MTWKNPHSRHACDIWSKVVALRLLSSPNRPLRSIKGMLTSFTTAVFVTGLSGGGLINRSGIMGIPLSDKDWTRIIGSGQSCGQFMPNSTGIFLGFQGRFSKEVRRNKQVLRFQRERGREMRLRKGIEDW